MLDDFLSGKRSYTSKPGELEKGRYGAGRRARS